MNDHHELQRPEGKVLAIALVKDGRSARQFAPAVNLSDARVRQIINGYQSVGGQQSPVVAPAATLARIALNLKVDPEDLRRAGRDDAADLMGVGADTEDPTYVASPGEAVTEGIPVSAQELRDELRAIRALLERMAERDEPRS